jgi:hypothetical protein
MNYAETKQKDGMQSQLVFLSDDSTDTEAWLRRARRALPNAVSPLISVDGADGPGAYGLNRKVTLTVLVADEGKVTANFPLIQPSIQVDGPKIGRAIALALGEKKSPTLRDMGFEDRRMNMRKGRGGLSPEQQGTYRRMMGPLIQKNATEKQVEAAAKAISEFADKHAWFKTKVHQASTLIVGGGRLANYGTAKAQGYLKTWSTEFAPAPKENAAGNAGKERPAASSKSKTTEANEPQETESAESVATPQ